MTVLTEGQHNAEFLVSESNGTRSREAITLAQDAAVYASGTVLKVNGANYDRHDGVSAATAVAVLLHDVDAISAAAPGVAFVRDIEFRTDKLVWDSAVDAGEQTAALANLATLGMAARDSQ